MTEAQLALKFIDYFAEFDIYKEVPGGGGIIDIVAVKSGIRTAIEVKVHLNFEVIWQAYQSRNQCHYAYAAVPIKVKAGYGIHIHPAQKVLCLHLGIGIIACIERPTGFPDKFKYTIEEIVKPQLNRHARKIFLHDYMKRSQAGSQSDRMTAFGYFVECFTTVVAKCPEGIEPKQVFESLTFQHYRTVSLFKNAVVKYCRTGVINNIEFRQGKFFYKKNA